MAFIIPGVRFSAEFSEYVPRIIPDPVSVNFLFRKFYLNPQNDVLCYVFCSMVLTSIIVKYGVLSLLLTRVVLRELVSQAVVILCNVAAIRRKVVVPCTCD